MPVVQITDNGATLNIIKDGASRLIVKAQVREITVVKATVVKIDLGLGALQNVYVDHNDVTIPDTETPEDLRDQLNGWLPIPGGGGGGGDATATNQVSQITALTSLQTLIGDVKTKQDGHTSELQGLNTRIETLSNKLDSVNNYLQTERLLDAPLLVDESNPEIVYRGFAPAGSATSDPVWAIQQVTIEEGVTQYRWANGEITFGQQWDNRSSIGYS